MDEFDSHVVMYLHDSSVALKRPPLYKEDEFFCSKAALEFEVVVEQCSVMNARKTAPMKIMFLGKTHLCVSSKFLSAQDARC